MKIRLVALCPIFLVALSAAAFADSLSAPEVEELVAKAQAGDSEAQYSLGKHLQSDKQYDEALSWYEKASAQGHVLATNNLAYLYELGLGVRQDHGKGFHLYARAADLGSAEAMWNISNMYRAGELGPPDMLAACEWAIRTERFSDPQDKKLLEHVHRVMPQLEYALTGDQLATCRKDGESWAPRARRGAI